MKCRPEEALFTCFPTTLMYIFFFQGPSRRPVPEPGDVPARLSEPTRVVRLMTARPLAMI